MFPIGILLRDIKCEDEKSARYEKGMEVQFTPLGPHTRDRGWIYKNRKEQEVNHELVENLDYKLI